MFMTRLRKPAACACATIVTLLLTGSGAVRAQGQDKPAVAEPRAETELNTVLMESTFRIEGSNTLGTAFVMGRPYPNETAKARYVLITAAHVLEEMQGDTAVIQLRHKVDEANWVRLPMPVQIRDKGRPLWTKHPSADVAVMYIRIPTTVSIPLLSTDLLADDKMLSKYVVHPGDMLQCLGYPLGMEANGAGFPILRSGRIASYPLLPTDNTRTFLLDFNVFKGNSGGPVYMVEANRMYGHSFYVGQIVTFIAGLVSQEATVPQQFVGPYSAETRQIQLGLAVVVHASLIKQAIYLLPSPETLPD
jgi:hypothetical protein